MKRLNESAISFKEAVIRTSNKFGHPAHLRKLDDDPEHSSSDNPESVIEKTAECEAQPSTTSINDVDKPKRLKKKNFIFKIGRLFKKRELNITEIDDEVATEKNKEDISENEEMTVDVKPQKEEHQQNVKTNFKEPEKSNVNCCSLPNPRNPWRNVLRLQDAIFFEIRVKLLTQQREHFMHHDPNLMSLTRYMELLKTNSVLNSLLLVCLNWGLWYETGSKTDAVEQIVKQSIYKQENIIGSIQALWDTVDPKWVLWSDEIKQRIDAYKEEVLRIILVYEELIHDLQINQPDEMLPCSHSEMEVLRLKLK